MREVPKSGPLVLNGGGSADPPDPPPGYGPAMILKVYASLEHKVNVCLWVLVKIKYFASISYSSCQWLVEEVRTTVGLS